MASKMRLTNPLEDDPVLKDLLAQLDRIQTRRGFTKWKDQFLTQFEMHLEGTNVTKASQRYHSFAKRIDRLALLLKQLEGLIRGGLCTPQKCTVGSHKTLAELKKALTGMIEHTQSLVPGTLEVEQKAGYTKFDMGAVLVRDGFVEYDRLVICNEILLHMKKVSLAEVADRQLLEEMDRYWQKVEAFYQIMGTDLGLHGAILRCRKILRAEDDEFLQYENSDDMSPFDKEAMEEVRALSQKEKAAAAVLHEANNDNDDEEADQNDEDDDEKVSELTTPTTSASEMDAPKRTIRKKSSSDFDELDAKQQPRARKKSDWENLREDPPKTAQRFEKVEIYGLDLPLRLIKLGEEFEDESTDFSDMSDYDSWCWALEMPEHTPKDLPRPAEEENGSAEEDAPDEAAQVEAASEEAASKPEERRVVKGLLDDLDNEIFDVSEKAASEGAESEPDDLVAVEYDDRPKDSKEKKKKSKKKPAQRRRMKSAPITTQRSDIDPETGLPRKLLGLSKIDDDDLLSSDDDEIIKARKKANQKPFKWNQEGYYHGDAAGW
eukprot:CAMPEP_0168728568 /NCGR_PEP_ID=MMETSP0724-20121128/5750_1 /TAXON_ID=265536 /ORGANISM="Amphiprora sp., Strain CCMP467" /LENGTH=547 /DNA_ID=CAMNT_0008775415 /DNA_START=121 /DNA_END=1761 /DNA_ORIENTATION=-